MAALLTSHVDSDLITETQGIDGCVEDCAIAAGIQESSEHHVARNPGKAIEVDGAQRLARRITAAAAPIGSIRLGRFATRTVTARTPGT